MTNILDQLGLDEEDINWQDFAACAGVDDIPPEYFDKYYQDNPAIRPVVDSICLGCPVIQECFAQAARNKESYVWAGVFFDNGTPVPEMNSHKTPEFKTALEARLREQD